LGDPDRPTFFGLMSSNIAAQIDPAAPSQVKVMFMFMLKKVDGEGIQVAENALIREFMNYGYTVLDKDIVAQTLHRENKLLQLYEIEAAKRLGAFLNANIVISGETNVHTERRNSSGTEVSVIVAEVSARAILVSTGKILAAESAESKKPFAITGQRAIQDAASVLAKNLLKGINEYLSRDTID
jgi:hypothetical protein